MKTLIKYFIGFCLVAILASFFDSCNAPQILWHDATILKLVDSFKSDKANCYTYQILLPQVNTDTFYLCTFQKYELKEHTIIPDSSTIDILQ
jgi:hypothetical protein